MASLMTIIFMLMSGATLVLGEKCGFYNDRWYKHMRRCINAGSKLHIGDLDGDRRADTLCHNSRNGAMVALVDGISARFQPWCYKTGQLHLGDFNGDGRQDLLCHDIISGYKWIAFADEHGKYKGTNWQKAMGWCYHKGAKLYIGDFNGDGRSDMLCHDTRGHVWISLADHKGHFVGNNWHRNMGFCTHAGSELHIGDFNGDCRSDLLCHDNKGWKWIALSMSAPHIGFSGVSWSKAMGWCWHSSGQLFVGEFNGDKRSDILCHDTKTGYKWLAYNHGPSTYFTSTSWESNLGWCFHSGAKLFVGDFNADNRDDILCHDTRGQRWIIYNECK